MVFKASLAIALGVSLYAVVDVLLTRPSTLRSLSRLAWVLLVTLVPLLGAIAWWLHGRPDGAGARPGNRVEPPPAPVRHLTVVRGPEDDPAFIRSLEEQLRRQRER
jgi:hypothetical protein